METAPIKNENAYVLTIDDDPDFNNLLQLMLKKLSVDVVTTDGPENFFKTFVKRKPKLCLIDIHLGKNYNAGFELIKLLRREKYENLPIIVISSVKNKEDIARALRLGANDYLTKPIERVLLAEKVRHFVQIDGHAYDPFKLFNVPARFSGLEMRMGLELIKVGVDRISFKSPVYFAPETLITINENFFVPMGHHGDKKIQVQVLQNRKIEDDTAYEIIERFEDFKKYYYD